MNRFISVCLALCTNQDIQAQTNIIIEPLDSCLTYIITWHQANLDTEKNTLYNYKEKKWYNLIPYPGIGYNLATNKPIVTFTLPDIVGYVNRKKDLKYRLQKTVTTNLQSIIEDTISFKTGYRQLTELLFIYEQQSLLLKNDSLLLLIKEEENKNLQATTEDVVKSKASLQEKQLALHQTILSIWSKVAAIEASLHRSFRINFR